MSVFKRWFGKSAGQPVPPPAPSAAGTSASSAPGSGVVSSARAPDVVGDEPSEVVSQEQQAAVRPVERPPAVEVPLKSLTTYQRDPAFQNFVRKMKRPPGATRSHAGGIGDGYPLDRPR